MTMFKVRNTILAALLILALIVVPMYAEEGETAEAAVEATVQVRVNIAGIEPKVPEKYKIILTPDSKEFPMPEEGKGGTYTLTITGKGTDTFPGFKFDNVGFYTYTVAQQKGNHPDAISYDKTVYKLKITVYRENDALQTAVAIHANENEEKTDNMVFLNRYDTTEIIDPPTPLGFGSFINVGDCLE